MSSAALTGHVIMQKTTAEFQRCHELLRKNRDSSNFINEIFEDFIKCHFYYTVEPIFSGGNQGNFEKTLCILCKISNKLTRFRVEEKNDKHFEEVLVLQDAIDSILKMLI